MILAMLAKSEMNVGEMAAVLGVSLANTSQHLSTLRSQHIVKSRKEGQTVFYHLADRRLVVACELIRTILIDGMKERGLVADKFDPLNVLTE
jgi:ArsR family transcriptional regulator, virulence genes transcriptional regulator